MSPGRFFLGLTFIVLGVLAFLDSLGYGLWVFWENAFNFWPVLLIVIGLGLVWGGKIPRLVGLVIASLVVAAIVFLALNYNPPGPYTPGGEQLIIRESDHPEITKGELDINFGGGKLGVNSSSAELLRGDFSRASPENSIREDGDRLVVRLKQEDRGWMHGHNTPQWEVALSPELKWDIDLDVGAVKGEIDLTGIPVANLAMDLGAGDVDLRMGDNGADARVSVDAGASNLKVYVPRGTGVRVRINGGLTNSNLEDLNWVKSDGAYVSPEFADAASKIEFSIDMAAGNFQLEIT